MSKKKNKKNLMTVAEYEEKRNTVTVADYEKIKQQNRNQSANTNNPMTLDRGRVWGNYISKITATQNDRSDKRKTLQSGLAADKESLSQKQKRYDEISTNYWDWKDQKSPEEFEEINKEYLDLDNEIKGLKKKISDSEGQIRRIGEEYKSTDSRLNKLLKDKETENAIVAQGNSKITDPYNRIRLMSDDKKGGWLQPATPEYLYETDLNTAKENNQKIYGKGGLIDQGAYGDSKDVDYYNKDQRKKAKTQEQTQIAYWEAEEKELQKKIDDIDYEYGAAWDLLNQTDPETYQQKIKEYNDLNDQLKEVQTRLKTSKGKVERIDQLDEMETKYGTIMGEQAGNIGSLQQEVNQLQKQYDEAVAIAEQLNPEKQTEDYYAAWKKADEIEKNLKSKQNELKELVKYGIDTAADSLFHDEWDKGEAVFSMQELESGVKKATVDRIYSFINGGREFETWGGNSGYAPVTNEYSGAMMMLYEEVDRFNELYNAAVSQGREPTEAQNFFEALQPYLNQRYRMYEQLRNEHAAKTIPILSSIGSALATTAEPLMALRTEYGQLTGADWAKDPYGRQGELSRMQTDVEGTIAKDLGPVAGTFYKGAMSAVKNAIRGVESMPFGAAAPAVNLTLFFGENYYNSYQQKLEETRDDGAAGLYALVDSGIATLFEVVSVEAMFSESKNVWQAFIKNVVAEASEEFNEGVIGPYIHELLDGSNEWKDRAAKILDEGGYEDQNGNWIEVSDEKEAWKQACREWNNSLFEAMITAGLSAGGSTLVSVTNNKIRNDAYNIKVGKTINNKANIEEGKSGAQQLAEVGVGMEGTETQKLAKKAMETIDKGGKLTNYEAGQLATTMARENEEKYHKTIKDTLERDVRQEMTEAGIPENVAKEAAAAVANITINNGKATDADITAIAKDERAMKVYQSYNSNPAKRTALANNIEKETAPQRSVAEKIGDLTGKNFKATGALAADIDAANRESGSKEEAVDNLHSRLGGIISERFANAAKTTLQTTKTLQKSKTFLNDVVQIRLAAYSMRTAMPKTNLDSQTAQTLWDEAKAEFQEEEENRVVRQTKVTPGKGIATYNGVSYGSGAWAQAVNGDKTLNGRQKLYMHTVAEITRRMGMAVNFINESGVQRVTSKTGEVSEINMEEVYGTEDQATGAVTVNIAGLDNNRMTHNAVVTVAHEFTHWLEQNSRNGYAALRQFVFDELRLQGTDVETELIRSINIQNSVLRAESGESLDLYGAVAEMVARGSEGLFTSAEMRSRLANQDEGLYNKVKTFVRQFVARLNAAIRGIDTSLSREARTLKTKVDEIAKLWLEGYDEALGRSEEGAEATEGERFSTARRELQETARRAAVEHPAVDVDNDNSLITVWGKTVTGAAKNAARYSVADNKTIRTLKMMADERILNNQDETKKILSKYKINTKSGTMAESSVMDYAGIVSKKDLQRLMQLESDTERWQQRKGEYDSIDENDPVAKYMAAWNNADIEAMQDILDQTMLSTPGVIPFKAAGWYNGDAHYSYYANAIKDKDPAAIMIAAAEMAEFVPDNAVLVPIPNRNGQVTENTDTMLLAKAISQLKGVPVVNALAGNDRMSRKEAKGKGIKQTAEDLGFRKVAEIPEGTVPYFIDNVVGSGVTAKAAHDAFGTGITLAYAKSTRAAIDGLKRSQNEIYGKGPMQFVRPLDQRADLSMTGAAGVRYSIKDMQKLSWDQQMDRAFSGKAHANDVYVILNKEEASEIGIKTPIALRQSIFTKGKRIKQGNTSKSAHELTKQEYLKLKDSINNPVARIENRGSVYIVTDQYKEQNKTNETGRKEPIVLVGAYKNEFLKGGVLDTVTVGGRTNISTLFGKFVDGKFVYDKEAKIFQYKNNAVDILSLSPSQFGAGPDVYDAIETLTQKEEKGKNSFSVAQRDKIYMDAVNSGDMETAQRMVDEKAREAGYNTNYLYWRGDSEPYNELLTGRDQGIEYDDPDNSGNLGNGLYFTPDRSYAERFAKDGVLRKFYLKYDAADLSDKDVIEEMNQIAEDITDESGYLSSDELFDELLARLDKNAIIGHNVGGFAYGADEIAVQESWQAKLADPVTYDDQGNAIPLSERFNDQKKDIRYSIMDDEFGYTNNINEAGYLLPDGRMLNFSGGQRGRRTMDHRDIDVIYGDDGPSGTDALIQFMNEGNIRIMPEAYGIDIGTEKEPTEQQYSQIQRIARHFAGDEEFNVDLSDKNGDNVGSLNYEGKINPTRIVNDIKHYFQTGEVRGTNTLDRFRYSVRQQDMEVTQFMLGLNEDNMTTAQEKTMVRQFKELNMALKIERHALNDRTKQLKALEAKTNPSAFDRKEMVRLRNLIDNNNKKLSRLEGQMVKATSEEGYARLMYQQEQNMRNTVSGRTSEEVRATIEALTRQVAAVSKEIDTRQKDIDNMRNDLSFKKTSALVDSSAAEKVAAMIRKMYSSRINKQDLIRAMTEIRLKIAAGKNIDAEAEELAWKVLSDATMDGGESLKRLRGTVIKLGKGQVKELLGSNSSLKELRSLFAGSGIQVRSARDGEVGLDGGSWEELCNIAPELDRNATELEQVNELIRFVQNQKQQMSGAEQYRDNIDEVVMDLKGWIASIGVNTPQDPGAMKILDAMNKLINEMATGIAGSAERLNTVKAQLAGLVDQGKLAISMTDRMQRDVEQAIRYNNTLAEQSEAALWKSEKWKLIEQLKSENTQNLLKEQEKWKEKIAKDKQARQTMQSNQQLRKQIHTNITRVAKLIFNETDLKNMPEHMKGLAREMIELIMRNDVNGRKITGIERKDLLNNLRTLDIMRNQDGGLNMDDIAQIHDEEAQDMVLDALADIEDGIKYYNAGTGKDIIANLQAFHNALDRIADAVATITNVIHAEQSVNIGDRKVAITEAAGEIIYDMSRSRFKGEVRGRGSKAINATKGSVVYGNMTPVYFFKNLMNRGMMKQWGELKRGQNRNGLETQKAADFLQGLAEKTNYKSWADQTHKVKIGNRDMTLTVGNIMEIYAIWQREQISKEQYPEMSSHMEVGGIYIDEDERTEGKLRREKQNMKAMRLNKQIVEDMYDLLTDDQKLYLNEVVKYLSSDMSELGNEASMKMYGIKKYKESWYFPMKVWDGVKSARSDKGISGSNENRAAHRGWSKRRVNNASNALVIGDFTKDAVTHIVEMINYNTMSPAIENFNKILNYQQKEIDETGVNEGDEYYLDVETPIVKRNVRIMFQEAYGKQALNYLETFLKDLNGGMVQDQRSTLRDRMISVFRKNAVAGSLSVTLQQPLSYIRAAMMISPKHLMQAVSPTYWKGSHAEMVKYSGVAVIKDMGRFDMNFGQSAKDYVAPDRKENVYGKVSNALTVLPELADRMTWTRMWSAVKIEQHELHPEMDMKSEEFLQMVAERFNDVMMATQVYDSVLVKSHNMRSDKLSMKLLTSFMAEPTLSLNVLSDAVLNVKEKGGKAMLGKAVATFALGAVLQAFFKGLMGSGRTPDDKKTWEENFLYKWYQNFIGEINPISLIPGYSDMIEVLKKGELSDDAMGVLGKFKSAIDTVRNAANGNGKGVYRDIEDSAAQIAQLFTNIPYKNIMRDMRAMYNWVSGGSYAKRDTSAAVLRKQTEAATWSADNLMGTINTWLGEAGFKTSNTAYYKRMYEARERGDEQEAAEIREYLMLGKGVEEKTISSKLGSMYYKDLWTAMDNNKAEEIGSVIKRLTGEGKQPKDIKSQITSHYKDAYLAADSAGKRRIRDAIQKAYKKMGLTAEDADKVINGWTKKSN